MDHSLPQVRLESCARIPNACGSFDLHVYTDSQDRKENLALVMGDIWGHEEILVRVHSECFTGDVLGSFRCDCGAQLRKSLRMIAEKGRGVLLYLRQEGRGIGLAAKLQAYNLQDLGFDTVDANLLLGHAPDERDYAVAALILKDLGVSSVCLLTNNPDKIEQLEVQGVRIASRVPLETRVLPENEQYLRTKVQRMRHVLGLRVDGGPQEDLQSRRVGSGTTLASVNGTAGNSSFLPPGSDPSGSDLLIKSPIDEPREGRPFVTLSYAQSIDGCIAAKPGVQLRLSGDRAMKQTHRLRACHDAILVGIGTVLADDPRLTVRLVEGNHPRPVILDSHLRFPLTARMLRGRKQFPLVATTEAASVERECRLRQAGVEVVRCSTDEHGRVDLTALMPLLQHKNIKRLMVEGGAEVITSFLRARQVDHVVLTVVPRLIGGGLHAIGDLASQRFPLPSLQNVQHQSFGSDLMLSGQPVWGE